jgi:hypothetical protein
MLLGLLGFHNKNWFNGDPFLPVHFMPEVNDQIEAWGHNDIPSNAQAVQSYNLNNSVGD